MQGPAPCVTRCLSRAASPARPRPRRSRTRPAAEFGYFLEYTRSLRFKDKPDYAYMRRLFAEMCTREGFAPDGMMDWMHAVAPVRIASARRAPCYAAQCAPRTHAVRLPALPCHRSGRRAQDARWRGAGGGGGGGGASAPPGHPRRPPARIGADRLPRCSRPRHSRCGGRARASAASAAASVARAAASTCTPPLQRHGRGRGRRAGQGAQARDSATHGRTLPLTPPSAAQQASVRADPDPVHQGLLPPDLWRPWLQSQGHPGGRCGRVRTRCCCRRVRLSVRV